MNYKWNILNETYNNDLIDKVIEFNEKYHIGLRNKQAILEPNSIEWVKASTLPNIDKGVERVKEAVNRNEGIMIAGDYDTDGVTATAVMYFGIRTLTPNVHWTVPNRIDGYGLSKKIIDEAILKGCSLIVTVDNGITAHEAIRYAQDNNVDVVVTDHHLTVDTLPCEIAIDPFVDSFYHFKSICGCMVAFKFLQHLLGHKVMRNAPWFYEAFALTAIATIGDVMELRDENRRFVNSFLRMVKKGNDIGVGLTTLFERIKNFDVENLTSTAVAFSVVPCINAMGRLSDAKEAVKLFLTDDYAEADRIATKMVDLNNLRKQYQNDVKKNLHVDSTDDVIVEVVDDIPHGIIGVVAGTVSSMYGKPCYLLSQNNKNNDMLTGSGRAPAFSNFNVGKFVSSNSDICKGGGHKGASGISLRLANLSEFKARCAVEAHKLAENGDMFEPEMKILCKLNFSQIDDDLMQDLQTLEPFGEGNREPLFCTCGVYVQKTRICGEFKNTIQMEFVHNGKMIKGICFNEMADKYLNDLDETKTVDICYTLQYNYWRGNRTIQIMVHDFRPATEVVTENVLSNTLKTNYDIPRDITFW